MPKILLLANLSDEENKKTILEQGKKLKEKMDNMDVEKEVIEWIEGFEKK